MKIGSIFKDIDIGPEMVVVPAGEFMMGSPENEPGRYEDEGPQHKVIIPRPFAVGRFAVTFNEWDASVADGGCGGYKPADQRWGRGRCPVTNVSWDDAQDYVRWLRDRTGEEYRLLSEAEWEYVARAGTATPYWWGAEISKDQANYNAKRTVPVDQFEPNPWGLYQVNGNVWEWCADHWHNNYECAPKDGSAWLGEGGAAADRVVRGGSWYNGAWNVRAACRYHYGPSDRHVHVGFRCARVLNCAK